MKGLYGIIGSKVKGIWLMALGENIQFYRKKCGLSQEELGQRLLVSRQTVSLWEKNQTAPTLDNLMRLKEVFGVSVDDILYAHNKVDLTKNANSLDTICASLAYAMGIEPPEHAAEKNYELSNFIDKAFDGKKADRVFMYNPDAIAQWIYVKYPRLMKEASDNSNIKVPLATVMPSVSPVCFATMYTGAQPAVHGIQGYNKPVITIDTLFDALVRAGKRVALITYRTCSLSRIYLGRNIDYYHFENKGITAVNTKAAELILRDEHDFIVLYNGNYDSVMHKYGPESPEALAELRLNCHIYAVLSGLIRHNWKKHNTLVGFAMDHGCHEIGDGGSHGLDTPEDINIVHLYKAYPRKED